MACLARNTFTPTSSILRSRQMIPIARATGVASITSARCMPFSFTTSAQSKRRHVTTSPKKYNHQGSLTTTILAQQRLRRPLSPHLTIYRPQITSVLSVAMRITGLAMSGAFCLFPIVYLAGPYLGLNASIASLAASFGGLPAFVKVPVKIATAWTLTFHCFNSLRFLRWDMAWGITNKQVARSGWVVVGGSFVGALALALL